MKLKKGICSIAMLAGVALMSAHEAYADVTVVYKMTSADGNGTQTIQYVDKQHVRIDMTDAKNRKTSMMKLGDNVYAITGKTVQDVTQLSKMMASMGMGQKDQHNAHAQIKYEDTGKTETIAGIRGKVYRFVDKGKSHEVVLGKDKNLQEAALGAAEIAKAATGMMPSNSTNRIQQDASIKSMALLRLDDLMHLESMNTTPVPDAVFILPASPQKMEGIGELMGR